MVLADTAQKQKKCRLDKKLAENHVDCNVVKGRCAVKPTKQADAKTKSAKKSKEKHAPVPREVLLLLT